MTDIIRALAQPTPQKRSIFHWAVVTQADPLRVRIVTEQDPLTVTPRSTIAGLEVSDVVRVEIAPDGDVIVIGRRGGPTFAGIDGTASVAQIPNLPASKITSGTLDLPRLPMVQGRTVCPAGGTAVGGGALYYSPLVSITFPAGMFSSPPRVRVSSSGSGVHFACVQGTPTTGGFNAVLTRLNAAPDGTQYFEWEAWQE